MHQDKDSEKTFTPPRHWIGPEQLEASYWADSVGAEKRGQEFFEKPIEMIDKIDRSDAQGFARREFLTIMGASMAMASFACARRPVHKIIPYVVKPEEITPGVATWYASTYSEGLTSVGVLVKNREGRPIKLEGNPDHPMNRGKLSAQAQASLLSLYDTDRLQKPMARASRGAVAQELSWSDADAQLSAKFKQIAASKGRVKVLSGEVRSPSTQKLIKEFLSAFGADSSHVSYEALGHDDLVAAQSAVFGTSAVPSYKFDQAQYILSLGADFLGNWIAPEAFASAWSKNRKLEGQSSSKASLSKLVTFEPVVTLTGANSDERYPVQAGDEYKIVMALIHVLSRTGKVSIKDAKFSEALSTFNVGSVAKQVGVDELTLEKIAHDLAAHKGKSLVVAGGLHAQSQTSYELQVAVALLNALLENEGKTLDGVQAIAHQSKFAELVKLVKEMQSGSLAALVIYRSNPVFTAPASLGFAEALKKVPFVVVINDREDETGVLADAVLPDTHFLESWGDASPRAGLFSLQQPALAPIHGTRSFQDTLIAWQKALGLTTASAKADDFHGYLMQQWKETVFKEVKPAGTFEQFWEGALRAGAVELKGNKSGAPRAVKWNALSELPKLAAKDSNVITLALYANVSMGDGRHANNAWLQEMPDPISSVTWDNYLAVGPSLAKELKLKQNDVVEISVGSVKAKLPVHIQPGMPAKGVGVAIGYGRQKAGSVGTKAGIDMYPFMSIGSKDRLIAAGMPVEIRRTDSFYPLAMTQWHFESQDRPIINDISLDEYRHNPKAEKHVNPHLRMKTVPTLWKKHEYKGYRWGMSIDLNSCTGCGACTIACQAENNIPVVGRAQVRNSRQMHWIRIDRYYSGSQDNPEFLFQPMLCQHCENAPCETVCPVVATMHDDEGLNTQVYNRCVGTRYCQNNCPYKVRRFNFFDHWKAYEGSMNLVWNPDVTVRTRGIMEKCTFCVQRIRDEKDKAKVAGLKVQDGQIKTACQQTCPTEAISFGDVNNSQSEVAQLRVDPRAFKVLEVINTEPAISYLTKVRNRRSPQHGHDHDSGSGHHEG